MRQYIARLLSERYEVYAAADGRQALEATQQMRPALVLADVMMPHLDGFGLLRAIREDSSLASTPVILLSARAGEESRVEGLEADADDYLIKPFAARELLARVAAHVNMAMVRRETAEREERMRNHAELEREKLRASEERLAETSRLFGELQHADAELELQVELLQQLPVSAWTLNPDGTPDFVNRVWLEFAGQTLDYVRSHPGAWMTAVQRPGLFLHERWAVGFADSEVVAAVRKATFESGLRYRLIRSIAVPGAPVVSRHVFTSGVPSPGQEKLQFLFYVVASDQYPLKNDTEVVIEKFEYLP